MSAVAGRARFSNALFPCAVCCLRFGSGLVSVHLVCSLQFQSELPWLFIFTLESVKKIWMKDHYLKINSNPTLFLMLSRTFFCQSCIDKPDTW
jgi:hypothetical protein